MRFIASDTFLHLFPPLSLRPSQTTAIILFMSFSSSSPTPRLHSSTNKSFRWRLKSTIYSAICISTTTMGANSAPPTVVVEPHPSVLLSRLQPLLYYRCQFDVLKTQIYCNEDKEVLRILFGRTPFGCGTLLPWYVMYIIVLNMLQE